MNVQFIQFIYFCLYSSVSGARGAWNHTVNDHKLLKHHVLSALNCDQ